MELLFHTDIGWIIIAFTAFVVCVWLPLQILKHEKRQEDATKALLWCFQQGKFNIYLKDAIKLYDEHRRKTGT
jgi:uncharacterized membrane protein